MPYLNLYAFDETFIFNGHTSPFGLSHIFSVS